MKKIFVTFIFIFSLIILSGCDSREKLYILNWGDYISSDLIKEFEKENNVSVKYTTAVSNEIMYKNIIDKKLPYDIVVPSDYMIDKMVKEGLLNTIDTSKLNNYKEGMYINQLSKLMNSDSCVSFKEYYIPYFWGSLGIMYNTNKEGVEHAVTENGFKVFFETNLLPEGTSVGMYDSSRDSFACAELYKGFSLNTKNKSELDECAQLLDSTNFDFWGTDDLKKQVSSGNLDVALVYSGDFFDSYYADTEIDKKIEYSIFAPIEANNVFFDGLVIPKTSKNVDLAHKFIDFMIQKDNALENASFVGYCPTLAEVYNEICNDEEWNYVTDINAYHPSKIVDYGNSKAEVYVDLGQETYRYVEELFIDIRG